MRHLDLFSGIGGFALAASWVWGAEHEIVSFCEIEPYAQKVLKKHWPDVPCHDDIKTFRDNFNGIDLLTGGFPCQDISRANPYAEGINGKRSGLWSEMFRVIGGVRPGFVVIENSSAIVIRGLSRLLCDLASIGYDAEWYSIRASQLGASHQRERTFILAYPHLFGQERVAKESFFREWKIQVESMRIFKKFKDRSDLPASRFLGSLTGIPNASHRIKGLGNAIVPQVVVPIMRAIKEVQCKPSEAVK